MSDASSPDEFDCSAMTYEQAVAALEEIVEQIEQGSIGLQQSIDAYKRGTRLINHCRSILDRAEQEIRTLETFENPSTGSSKEDEA